MMWCCLLDVCVWTLYAWVFTLCYQFPTIESNEECAEEGEVYEYQEEGDQGQANQGKPSTLLHIWILITLLHVSLSFIKVHGFMLL
jgi:hypothetical protein